MAGPYHALSADTATPDRALSADAAGQYHALSTAGQIAAPSPSNIYSAHRRLSITTQVVESCHQLNPAVRRNPRITLNNPILPIVGLDKVTSGIDSAVMAPAMQLVSHFLLTPASLQYIYTVVFTPASRIPWTDIRHSTGPGPSFAFYEKPAALTPDQSAQALQALDDLADRISIELLIDAPPGAWGCTKLRGCTKSWKPMAIISLSCKCYENLVRAAADERWNDHVWLILQLTTILLHELGHAILRLSQPRGDYYFPAALGAAAQVAEEGYEYTRRVLGGAFFRIKTGRALPKDSLGCNTPATRIVLYQWPSPAMISQYIAGKCAIGLRGEGLGKQRPTQPVVPFEYVKDILREEFWDRVGNDEKAVWPMCVGEMKVKMEEKMTRMRWRMFVGSAKRTMEGLLWGWVNVRWS